MTIAEIPDITPLAEVFQTTIWDNIGALLAIIGVVLGIKLVREMFNASKNGRLGGGPWRKY